MCSWFFSVVIFVCFQKWEDALTPRFGEEGLVFCFFITQE